MIEVNKNTVRYSNPFRHFLTPNVVV